MTLSRKGKVLQAQYREMHRGDHFQGMGCLNYYWKLRTWIAETQSQSVLDYGCGKGRQFETSAVTLYHKLGVYIESWQEGLEVATLDGYDPAWPKWETRPQCLYDGVYCCSVLEHLEEEDIPAVVADIFQYARKFVFFAVGTTPAKKDLPDGRNAHITVRPVEWWRATIQDVATHYPDIRWEIQEEREKESHVELGTLT